MLTLSCGNSLRDGEGDWVDKPPWRITWGGGASVESPHFQRVHYCELLVRAEAGAGGGCGAAR